MNLKVVHSGKKYKVKDVDSGKTFSKAPIPKARAERQLKHIEAAKK